MVRHARGMRKSIHSAEYRRLCDLMIQARRRARLTQDALAKRLGRPQSFVAKFEGGERRLDVVEFVAVARAIRADPLALLRELIQPRKEK
jgi:transcriptional regulator with XRE-family HTH domain